LITIFREEATSALAGSHKGALSWLNWNLECFCGGRKTEAPREKPSEEARTKNELNPPMAPGRNPTRATLVGGSHHRTISAPLARNKSIFL